MKIQQRDPKMWLLVGRLESLVDRVMEGSYNRELAIAALKKITNDLEVQK